MHSPLPRFLVKLVSSCVTAETPRAKIDWKSAFSKVSKFVQNFRYDSSPTDHSFCRKTGMIDLCYVRISAEIRFFHFVAIYAFDGQTNRRTALLLQWQRLAMVCSAVIKDIVNFNPSFDGLWLWLVTGGGHFKHLRMSSCSNSVQFDVMRQTE